MAESEEELKSLLLRVKEASDKAGLKLRKEYIKYIWILSACLFNWYTEYITQNARLDEVQTRIKISGRNTNNFRYADDTTLMAESEKTKEPLDESEREEWKNWLKAQHSEN